MFLLLILIFAGMIDPVFAQTSDSSLQSKIVSIPGGEDGINFDELAFSTDSHKILVPAGQRGMLYLINPQSLEMTSIGGFSSHDSFQFWNDTGIYSADEEQGFIFIPDHGKHQLMMVDINAGIIVGQADLAGDPNDVRSTGVNGEVWVTEPRNKQIEVFKYLGSSSQVLKSSAVISLSGSPGFLLIDRQRGLAYTNFGNQMLAIGLRSHLTANLKFPTVCQTPRGAALDEQKNFLFISCQEGKVITLDLNHDNKEISNLDIDSGADMVSYNSKLSHLYVASGTNASLSVLWVSSQGELSLLGQAHTDSKAHCVVSDDQNNIWVCDPPHGQLLLFKDTL